MQARRDAATAECRIVSVLCVPDLRLNVNWKIYDGHGEASLVDPPLFR
jgi:hypothetical protein